MASKNNHFVYWDSCIFLAWINNEPSRASIIQGMWDDITKNKDGKIVTSAISIVEVSHVKQEKLSKSLNPRINKQIDDMWNDPYIVIVEANTPIMNMAKGLMREVIPKGWSLKGYDAVHLATAKFVEQNGIIIQEFDTYDDKLFKYSSIINITVQEPHYVPQSEQLGLFNDNVDE